MVAMATHGRSGLRRWALGSVAETVLHTIPAPLLLIRAQASTSIPPTTYRTIVVPLDGSPLAEQALGQVLPLVKATGATLLLVAVAPPPDDGENAGATELAWVAAAHREETTRLTDYLAQVAARLQPTQLDVQTRLLHGHPAEEILRLSDEVDADLIAMSTHGRSSIQRFWLGSVALKVVQSAYRPVLLIRGGTH
jgi:nucleotide-binding universal stress UspA family protein